MNCIPFTDVEKSLGEWVMAYFERCYVFVLIGSDGNKLGFGEARREYVQLLAAHKLVYMNARFVFVKRVEHDLALVRRLVRELDLAERYRVLHPVGAEVGRVRVLVFAFLLHGLGLGALLPFAVYVLPLVIIDLLKVNNNLVDAGRVETSQAYLQHWKHVS